MFDYKGNIWKFGDDIDTDIIIPTQYLALETIEDMKQYAFSPLREDLAGKIQPGDIIIAGRNFGCGSSREQAPEVIAALKVGCIIAQSYARIFFRNAINNGLLLIEHPDIYNNCSEGDSIEITLNQHIICNGKTYEISNLPEYLLAIIQKGGLVNSMIALNEQKEEKSR